MNEIDSQHIWHPYSTISSSIVPYFVSSAKGAVFYLEDGTEMIDGISSWWCVNHGYSHPKIVEAMKSQLDQMSHIMFGGLTHSPAIELTQKLLHLLPFNATWVLYADSGSVAVEAAIKIARQYWQQKNKPHKNKMVSLLYGYHGDTTGAAMVSSADGCVPKIPGVLPHYFLSLSANGVSAPAKKSEIKIIEDFFQQHCDEIAGFVVEPIFQGAGGIRFYSAQALADIYELCKKYEILVIADEIASGFGRTGKLFACEHAGIQPDIICVGKALTGGMINLAATICSNEVAKGACSNETPLSYGPTFMASPLACAAAMASIDLFSTTEWKENVRRIERKLENGLRPFQDRKGVVDVRVLGAIGAIEMDSKINTQSLFGMWKEKGVWLRPFGHVIYTMPPYTITDSMLDKIIQTLGNVVDRI